MSPRVILPVPPPAEPADRGGNDATNWASIGTRYEAFARQLEEQSRQREAAERAQFSALEPTFQLTGWHEAQALALDAQTEGIVQERYRLEADARASRHASTISLAKGALVAVCITAGAFTLAGPLAAVATTLCGAAVLRWMT